MEAIEPVGCNVLTGMVLNESCPTCGHMVWAHVWPTGVCTQCWEEDRYEALERRIRALESKAAYLNIIA